MSHSPYSWALFAAVFAAPSRVSSRWRGWLSFSWTAPRGSWWGAGASSSSLRCAPSSWPPWPLSPCLPSRHPYPLSACPCPTPSPPPWPYPPVCPKMAWGLHPDSTIITLNLTGKHFYLISPLCISSFAPLLRRKPWEFWDCPQARSLRWGPSWFHWLGLLNWTGHNRSTWSCQSRSPLLFPSSSASPGRTWLWKVLWGLWPAETRFRSRHLSRWFSFSWWPAHPCLSWQIWGL